MHHTWEVPLCSLLIVSILRAASVYYNQRGWDVRPHAGGGGAPWY